MIMRMNGKVFSVLHAQFVGLCLAAVLATSTTRWLSLCRAGEDGNLTPQSQDGDPQTEYDVTLPPLNRTYRVGDMVSIGGPNAINWLGNVTMDVYILPHRLWKDGDSMRAGAIHRTRVKTDAMGTILRSQIWKADRPGKFDLAVDYENDGIFSFALDAVGGMRVEDPNAKEIAVALDDQFRGSHSRALVVDQNGVLDNDHHRPKASLQARKVTEPRHGILDFRPDGTFRYTPKLGFVGVDQFTYDAFAPSGQRESAIVVLRITNAEPIANNDKYGVPPGRMLTVQAPGILANDSDKDGDRLTAILRQNVRNGKLDLRADGSFTYAPNPGFEGNDNFAYTAFDGIAIHSHAVVEISVQTTAPTANKPSQTCGERARRHVFRGLRR